VGKREANKKEKSPRDYYSTIDPDAIKPLLPYLHDKKYYEPCGGSGELITLVNALSNAKCLGSCDIHPLKEGIIQKSCMSLSQKDLLGVDFLLSNPPFTKENLLPMIDHLASLKPTWLLLPADMLHNLYMVQHLRYCDIVLSVGRLCWFPDEKGKFVKGVDNYCFYRFDKEKIDCDTVIKGRVV